MPDPHLRAADTDREAVATALGQHMAAGRLTLAEYDERVAQAWAARTFGDLAPLTADLPATPAPVVRTPPRTAPRTAWPACGPAWGGAWASPHREQGWQAWLSTAVIVLVVYLAVSLGRWEFGYFWPMWVIGPWGAVLLAERLAGPGRVDARRRG